MRARALWCGTVLAVVVLLALPLPRARVEALAGADAVVYTDTLAAGWSNWSWGTAVSFSAGSPVHSGGAAIAVTYTAAWGGLYLHVEPPLAGASYRALRFFLHGGSAGGQTAARFQFSRQKTHEGGFAAAANQRSYMVRMLQDQADVPVRISAAGPW